MSALKLKTLYYYSCELRPDLPSQKLLNLLGQSWAKLIIAGATGGLVGTPGLIGDVTFEQCANVYQEGAESGAGPDMQAFRSGLASSIYEKLCSSDSYSTMEKIKLSAELFKWVDAAKNSLDNDVMDMDADVSAPMFTKTGLWVLDKISGEQGVPQEVITILARPEAGKSTLAVSLACQWRRNNIGPVSFIQSELSPAAMRLKLDSQSKGEGLWRSGIDRMVFGPQATELEFDRCLEEGDQDRLVIVDSVTGHCGSGDTPDGRMRHVDLYTRMMRVKNKSRMVVATAHVKQGEDVFTIESAAGSAAVSRMSGLMVCIEKEEGDRPDGMSDIRISTVKNRWGPRQRPFIFTYDYITGEAIDTKNGEW